MEFFTTRVSSLRQAGNVKYEARDMYYLYKDEFGFPPKQANHLVQFAKQKDYVLKSVKAEELLNDPPHPPKRRLANGLGYDWGYDDSSDEDEDKEMEDMKLDTVKRNKQTRSRGNTSNDATTTDFDKLKRTQLIAIEEPPNISEMNKFTNNINSINDMLTDDTLYDESGYYILPFTNHIIFSFHLDFSTKQWPKASRMFLQAIHDVLAIKRRDYNILTINKHEHSKQESRVSILIRNFNHKWPDYEEEANAFKLKTDQTLTPLKKTFRDSHHLLKMLKKLQFGEIDTGGKNQVDRTEFDAYFNANSVEPLDPQVLTNLFTTLDADGDGEITALEFFKWKTTFSATKLTAMFPIVNYKICDLYRHCPIPRLKAGFFELQQHLYKRLQDFPFQLDIKHMFYVNHHERFQKYQSIKGFEQSKLLFLVHKKGIGDFDMNRLLKRSINKKGKYFDDKGIYGQGYYFTSHLPYALNDIFYDQTSAFDSEEHEDENSHHLGLMRGHQVQLSAMDESRSTDFTHGEYTLMVCLVNPGKIRYIKEFERGKKIKSADSNCVQRIMGDWEKEKLFGRPESHYDEHGYYTGTVYDCYVIKNHERILPQYMLTIKRIKQCFIWMDEDGKYDNIKDSAHRLINARARLKKLLPNIIYGGTAGSDNTKRIIKMVRLKMHYNSVFLLRFVGMDVNVNRTISAFVQYIKGSIDNINIKIYPITIIYNVTSRKQLWNLIFREHKNKPFRNVHGSAKQIFEYVRDHLGGNKGIKRASRSKEGCISVIVMSIKFIKSDKNLGEVMIQQIEDAKHLEAKCKEDATYDPRPFDGNYEDRKERDKHRPGLPKQKSAFTIQITGVDAKEEDPVQRMLVEERIDKLLELQLPEEVAEYLGAPKSYALPEDKQLMQDLERDMKKMHQGLHDQSPNQRKYSKLAMLKHYDSLCAIYDKYCKLGGDRHWLTLDGFLWILRDGMIPNKHFTVEPLIELFHITYKMHHRLQSRYKSKHKIELSAMYGGESFHDNDPWSGIWQEKTKEKTANDRVYKLRKIGDLRLSGCIDSMSYAHISGGYNSLNYRKAELEIKYQQRQRAGIKRIWNAELIAPAHVMDPIKMEIKWTEVNTGYKAANAKSGKLSLEKVETLSDQDKDLPKDQTIGLSRHEFFDLILSVASTKFGMDWEYQFICVEKLLSEHLDAYVYQVIQDENLYLMSTNEEVKNQVRKKSHVLRKLFKYYASLDSDDTADDDGLGLDEWCTFATELCKAMKVLNKKVWKNGGQPVFEDMKAAFILSKADHALEIQELDYQHFEKCVVNLVHYMFKVQPNAKYHVLPFDEKLQLMFKACEKMIKTTTHRRDSTMLKKMKLKTTFNVTSPNSIGTPQTPGSSNFQY